MQGESALEIETLAQLCVLCRIEQVRTCKKYLLFSRECSLAISLKYTSICAMRKKKSTEFVFKEGSRFSSFLQKNRKC